MNHPMKVTLIQWFSAYGAESFDLGNMHSRASFHDVVYPFITQEIAESWIYRHHDDVQIKFYNEDTCAIVYAHHKRMNMTFYYLMCTCPMIYSPLETEP